MKRIQWPDWNPFFLSCRWIGLLLLSLLFQGAEGRDCQLGASFTLLYWRAFVPPWHYADLFSDLGSEVNYLPVTVGAGSNWGGRFRISGEAKCLQKGRPLNLHLELLHFQSSQQTHFLVGEDQEVDSPFFLDNLATPVQFGRGKSQARFSRVHLILDSPLLRGCRGSFNLALYLGWIYIQRKDRARYVGESVEDEGLFSQRMRFNGEGAEVGCKGSLNLCYGFSVRTTANLVGYVGQRKLSFSTQPAFTAGFAELNLKAEQQTACFTGWNLYAGLNHQSTFSCFSLLFELGYEMQNYFCVLREEVPVNTFVAGVVPGNTIVPQPLNFGFGGPCFTLELFY